MIREIFEKESSHGNSSPPCSVFFVLCLLVLRARIISWRVSWFPQCILGRHRTREILEPRGFLINTDPGAIFHVYALPADLDQGQKSISSGSTLGMRTLDFFSLCQEPIKWWAPAWYSCLLPSNSLPDLWVEGRYTGVHRQWVDRPVGGVLP